MTLTLDGTAASLIESISFDRIPGPCKYNAQHHRYGIGWHTPAGLKTCRHIWWCSHPLCEQGETRWRLSTCPAEVKLTQWIPCAGKDTIAVAYLLIIFPVDRQPHMEARIGICDQWENRRYGNLGNPDERRLFTQRYFAESGPGVYPATIREAHQ